MFKQGRSNIIVIFALLLLSILILSRSSVFASENKSNTKQAKNSVTIGETLQR